MSSPGYPLRINNLFIYQNDCAGVPQTTSDGEDVFWFPGTDSLELEAGPTFRTIAGVATECFSRDPRNVTSGADAVFRRGCGFDYPEFDSLFLAGYTREFDAAGNVLKAIEAPGVDACKDCNLNPAATDCDLTFSMVADVCYVDCDDVPINRQFMVIRSISQATLSNRYRVGGNNVDAFGGDIAMTLDSNDGYGEGPADAIKAYSTGTTPGTNPVVTNVPIPAVLDFTDLDAICECLNEFRGCPITAALVLANPELDHPLITGLPVVP